MEALRTQIDGLRWEVQRLEVENRRLREGNPATSAQLDSEMELAGARANITEMTDRIEELEQQLADQTQATAEAGRRATEAETRVAELGERMEELSAANERRGTPDRAVAQLEEALQVSEDQVQQLKTDLAGAEAVHRAAAAEKEAWREQAELERYRSLEEARRRWEARESRLLASLEAAEEELRAKRATTVEARDYARLSGRVRNLTSALDASQSLVDSLTEENRRLARDNERLGRENVSVRDQERRRLRLDVEEEGGHENHALWTTTAGEPLGRSRPSVQTELAGDELYYCGDLERRHSAEEEGGHGDHVHQPALTRNQPRQQGDSDFTGGRRALASTGAQQDKAPQLTWARTANSPCARRGDTSSPGLLAQQSLLRRGGAGVVVGQGCGGDHLWDDGEETPHYQGNGGGCTSADGHTRVVGQPAQASCSSCKTLTTFSSNHPQVTTFSGPATVDTSPRSQTVSGGYNLRGQHGICETGQLPYQGVQRAPSSECRPPAASGVQPQVRGRDEACQNQQSVGDGGLGDGGWEAVTWDCARSCRGGRSQSAVNHGPTQLWAEARQRDLSQQWLPGTSHLLSQHLLSQHSVAPVVSDKGGAHPERAFVGDTGQGSRNMQPPTSQTVPATTVPLTSASQPTLWRPHITQGIMVPNCATGPPTQGTSASSASAHQPGESGVILLGPASAAVEQRIEPSTTMPTRGAPTTTVTSTTAQSTIPVAGGWNLPPQSPLALLPPGPLPIMGQIPPIPKFTGEGCATGESFAEWNEHFENVAKLAGWNDQWKLVHLKSSLRDTAMAFYRSCSAEVRNDYAAVVAAMERRFTPIRLTAVQAQLFHNCHQQENETVDQFAQELQKLYNLAYAGAASEGPHAQRMGQTLLTNQFVTGLRPDLKRKLIGVEGSLEELVLKARFEEAKTRELVDKEPRDRPRMTPVVKAPRPLTGQPSEVVTSMTTTSVPSTAHSLPSRGRGGSKSGVGCCFNCGMEGHGYKNCPYPKRSRQDEEARGRSANPPRSTVSALVGEGDGMERLSQRLQKLETKVLNTVTAERGESSCLGPSVTAEIHVNGVPTCALIDTGSPATVISLDFVLDVFVKGRPQGQSPKEWREATMKEFSPPSVMLKAYSGHQLDVCYQVRVRLARGSQSTGAVILVQEGAPHDLLLGTDLQPKLGFALVAAEGTKLTDLITGEERPHLTQTAQPGGGHQAPLPGPGGDGGVPRGRTRSLQQTAELSRTTSTVSQQGQVSEDGVERAGAKRPSPGESTPLAPSSAGGPTMYPSIGQPEEYLTGGSTGSDTLAVQGQKIRLTGVVSLLKAVKVPPGYKKIVKTQISGDLEESLLLFTPELSSLALSDGVLEGKDGSCASVVVENHGMEPVFLEEGTKIGTVTPVEEVIQGDSGKGGKVCGLGEVCGGSVKEPGQLSSVGVVYQLGAETIAEEETGSRLPCRSREETVCDARADSRALENNRTQRLLEHLGLRTNHLTHSERGQLTRLITSFSDIFALDASELGTTTLVQHVINTGDHTPIRQQLRRMPFALRHDVDQMVGDMLEQGVIQPSNSPWASPVVLVRKKDGGMRFCIDYRRLNQVTKLDEYPLPRIDDTLDLLTGARYFTTLDLASGYWQVAMDPASKEKTAFTTYSGLYEFCKMPFGLVNAPATFQRLMEAVLSGLARGCCHVYLDDVLVFGRTLGEHNSNLTKVFGRLRAAGLKLKPKKCDFAQPSVEYLGHVVSAAGIQTDPQKLRAVNEYPTPMDLKSLRSFLGLASYYRRFVPGFSKVAAPLNALTRKDIAYVWTPDCQQAFEKMKSLLTTAPLLKYPDFSKPFILETDASGDGLGAVLAQRQDDGSVRPIAYASRSLQKHEKNYGITELEGLGVVWGTKHFRPYLYGHQCTVFTDHEALKSLLNTPQPSGKLARWGMALLELSLKIEHRSGKHNANADALSRHPLPESTDSIPEEGMVAQLSVGEEAMEPEPGEENELAVHQRMDAELKPLIDYLETRALPPNDKDARRIVLTSVQYTLQDDVLYKVEGDGTLRVVPPVDQRKSLFLEAHGGRFGAHLGNAKVYSELQRHYWWVGMRRDITQWTRGCVTCATRNVGRAVKPPLTPIPVAGPFDRVGVDVIQFPRSRRGNQYAIVFVDYLTKWPEVFPVSDQSAATIANLLVEEVVSRHGVPSEVLSDRGRAFLSGLLREVQQLLGFKKANTSAYHPQTDGLVERFNRTLTAMLAKTVQKGGPDWDERLPYVLFAYRACQQSSTQESPFYLLYGRDPRLPVPAVLSPKEYRGLVDLKQYGVELHSKMSGAWEMARQQITRAQKRQKHVYDQHTMESPFQAGERVFLFKPAEQTGARRKFARPFHGPYRLVEVDVNTAKIRPVDQPESELILVSLDRLRRCPDEIGDEFWPPRKSRSSHQKPHKGQSGLAEPTSGALCGDSGDVSESLQVGQTAIRSDTGSDTEGALNGLQIKETVGDKRVEVSSTPKRPGSRVKRGERAPEETLLPSKWAGRLRSRGLPRTSARQQGEM